MMGIQLFNMSRAISLEMKAMGDPGVCLLCMKKLQVAAANVIALAWNTYLSFTGTRAVKK